MVRGSSAPGGRADGGLKVEIKAFYPATRETESNLFELLGLEPVFKKAEHRRVIVAPNLEYAAMAFTPDPFGDWIRAHRAEMQRFIGRFVVIDPVRGILGAGDDPVELGERLDPDRHCMVTFVARDLYGTTAP